MDYFYSAVIKSVLEIDYFSAKCVISSVTAEFLFVLFCFAFGSTTERNVSSIHATHSNTGMEVEEGIPFKAIH